MVSSFSHPPCRSKGRRWRISSQRPRIERGMPKANKNRLRSQCGENSFLQTKLNLKLPKSWYFDPKIFKVFSLLAMCLWVNPRSDAIHFPPIMSNIKIQGARKKAQRREPSWSRSWRTRSDPPRIFLIGFLGGPSKIQPGRYGNWLQLLAFSLINPPGVIYSLHSTVQIPNKTYSAGVPAKKSIKCSH